MKDGDGMTLLNQIVAVEAGVKSETTRVVTDLHRLSQNETLLSGRVRTYTPRDDEGERLPEESQPVQLRHADVLVTLADKLTRLFDVVLTKDVGNTGATANITVDGVPLLEDVPVTYLLFLEKQLVDLRTFVGKLSVLDPSVRWELDPATGDWRSAPVETTRTKKIPRNWVKAEATREHPAQVEVYHEDVVVGTWATTRLSGALPALRKGELTDRIDRLLTAVKYAREAANSQEIADKHVGATVFGWLFA
jgi:hypothetical protein